MGPRAGSAQNRRMLSQSSAGKDGRGGARTGPGAAGKSRGASDLVKAARKGAEALASGGTGVAAKVLLKRAAVPAIAVLLVVALLAGIAGQSASMAGLDQTTYRFETASAFLDEDIKFAAIQAGAANDVPWAIILAIQTLATESGKYSPYDEIIRASEPPEDCSVLSTACTIRATWAAASGRPASASEYKGGISSDGDVVPAIGEEGQAQGPYLLNATVADRLGRGAQNLYIGDGDYSSPSTATEFIAAELARLRDKKFRDDGHVDLQDSNEAIPFWTDVVRNLPIVDPRDATCDEDDQYLSQERSVDVQSMVDAIWRCELQTSGVLYTLQGPEQQLVENPISLLMVEAMSVAWAWSEFGQRPGALNPDACAIDAALRNGEQTNAAPAARLGVFPISYGQFETHVAGSRFEASNFTRCDARANVYAAVKAFLVGETARPGTAANGAGKVDDRSDELGPFRPMIGGWAAIPWALGAGPDGLGRFVHDGPFQPKVASEECMAAIETWSREIVKDPGVRSVVLREDNDGQNTGLADALRETTVPSPVGSCSGLDTTTFQQLAGSVLTGIAAEYKATVPKPPTSGVGTLTGGDGIDEGVIDDFDPHVADPNDLPGVPVDTGFDPDGTPLGPDDGDMSDVLDGDAAPTPPVYTADQKVALAVAGHLEQRTLEFGWSELSPATPGQQSVIARLSSRPNKVAVPMIMAQPPQKTDYAAQIVQLARVMNGVTFHDSVFDNVGQVEDPYLGVAPSSPPLALLPPKGGLPKLLSTVASMYIGYAFPHSTEDGTSLLARARADSRLQFEPTLDGVRALGGDLKFPDDVQPGDLIIADMPAIAPIDPATGKPQEGADTSGTVKAVGIVMSTGSYLRDPGGGNPVAAYPMSSLTGDVELYRVPVPAEELFGGGFGGMPAGIPYAALFEQAGAQHNVPPLLLAATAKVESSFNPRAVSHAGARGLMQIMPFWYSHLGISDPFDPAQSINGGARITADNYAMYQKMFPGDEDKIWTLTIAAYNAGPGNVKKAGYNIPNIPETIAYVPKVKAAWKELEAQATAAPTGSFGGSWAGAVRWDSSPNGPVPIANVRGIEVHADYAPNLEALLAAADASGIHLTGWGYRSHQRQIELRSINGCPDVWTARPSSCRVPTAIPGRSNHESGYAIDFVAKRTGRTIQTQSQIEFVWMAANAGKFGFINLPSEPWHWSRNGQ